MWLLTAQPDSVETWLSEHAPDARVERGRSTGTKQLLVIDAPATIAAKLEAFASTLEVIEAAPAPAITFGGTRPRLTVYSRNAISYLATRSWGNATKKDDVRALKAAKASLDQSTIEQAANDLASMLERQVGRDTPHICVTHVACGHSKRPDCFACRVAQAVAAKLGMSFRKLFRDRPVAGVSHPKEFSKLPPLEFSDPAPEPTILVLDDVATSGWHMEEAMTALRATGKAVLGATWIAGNVE